MSDGKFGLLGVVLFFVTISLIFQMDFATQVEFVFDSLDIDIEEMSNEAIEEVLSRSEEETFNQGYYTYPQPTMVENKINKDKYEKLTKIIDLEKDKNAILIRGYDEDGYLVVRYYLNHQDDSNNDDVIAKYQSKLVNSGYEEVEENYTNIKFYKKDKIEVSFVNKWDCIILMVKGL